MTVEWVIALGRKSLIVILSLAMPMLGVGMFLGIFMSVLQTVTSIKDQSMTTVVKIVGVVGALLCSLPWIINTLITFINNLYLSLPSLVAK